MFRCFYDVLIHIARRDWREYYSQSATNNGVVHLKKKYISNCRIFLALCMAWIPFTFCANIVRIFSLQLLDDNISIESISEVNTPGYGPTCMLNYWNLLRCTDILVILLPSSPSPLRYFLVILTLAGYIIVDLVYISVLINYVSQCQLIIVFITSITEGVRNKSLSLEEASKVCIWCHQPLCLCY